MDARKYLHLLHFAAIFHPIDTRHAQSAIPTLPSLAQVSTRTFISEV